MEYEWDEGEHNYLVDHNDPDGRERPVKADAQCDCTMTMLEVGQQFNVTRERIRRIEAKTQRKL